jgi:hypothetical protein
VLFLDTYYSLYKPVSGCSDGELIDKIENTYEGGNVCQIYRKSKVTFIYKKGTLPLSSHFGSVKFELFQKVVISLLPPIFFLFKKLNWGIKTQNLMPFLGNFTTGS